MFTLSPQALEYVERHIDGLISLTAELCSFQFWKITLNAACDETRDNYVLKQRTA